MSSKSENSNLENDMQINVTANYANMYLKINKYRV